MREWSVTLGFEHDIPADRMADKVDDLLEALEHTHAAASYRDRWIRVQLTVTAPTMYTAMNSGISELQEACRETRIRMSDIGTGTAQTMESLEREQDLPNAPDLIGVAELALLLGVTRQRASELARAGSGFPRPLALLASGPVWDKVKITRYLGGWDRRPRGRPKRVSVPV